MKANHLRSVHIHKVALVIHPGNLHLINFVQHFSLFLDKRKSKSFDVPDHLLERKRLLLLPTGAAEQPYQVRLVQVGYGLQHVASFRFFAFFAVFASFFRIFLQNHFF